MGSIHALTPANSTRSSWNVSRCSFGPKLQAQQRKGERAVTIQHVQTQLKTRIPGGTGPAVSWVMLEAQVLGLRLGKKWLQNAVQPPLMAELADVPKIVETATSYHSFF